MLEELYQQKEEIFTLKAENKNLTEDLSVSNTNFGNLEEKLFVKEFSYEVIEYPVAQLSLVITTVSANEAFLSI